MTGIYQLLWPGRWKIFPCMLLTHLWPLCALRSPVARSWGWWWLAGWSRRGWGTRPGSAAGRGQPGRPAGRCWWSLARPWCRSLAWWFEVTGAGLLWVPAGCWQASLERIERDPIAVTIVRLRNKAGNTVYIWFKWFGSVRDWVKDQDTAQKNNVSK